MKRLFALGLISLTLSSILPAKAKAAPEPIPAAAKKHRKHKRHHRSNGRHVAHQQTAPTAP
jgi:hypothetical protein